MSSVFNQGFFKTAATVIPVLLLSVTLQGNLVLEALKLSFRWRQEGLTVETAGVKEWTINTTRVVSAYAIGLAAAAVLAYGVSGEITAFEALENRHATVSATSHVMETIVTLIIAFVASFLYRFLIVRVEDIKKRGEPETDGMQTCHSEPTSA